MKIVKNIEYANNAGHANDAEYANDAGHANNAGHANDAGHVKNAEHAGHANNAEYAVHVLLGSKTRTCRLGAVGTVDRPSAPTVAVRAKIFLLM